MPKGLSLSANLWRQRQGGIQFHERLIITDVAGVLLDPGLDEGKPGEKYDITSKVAALVEDSVSIVCPKLIGLGALWSITM
jgi:hypothetical protein